MYMYNYIYIYCFSQLVQKHKLGDVENESIVFSQHPFGQCLPKLLNSDNY